MDTSAVDSPEPVVLIIADISGYTRYMTANVKTFAHSQTIITELVKALVQEVELPLEVAKLEGDAVFLFARKGTTSDSWAAHKRTIGQKLFLLFEVFRRKVRELTYSTTCNCNACTHIESLRLKLIAHSGEALFHRVFNFQELAGVDVIIVHRLLKNSVAASQYLLLTDAAQKDIELPEATELVRSVESYDDIGKVNVGVYYPERRPASATAQTPPRPATFAERFGVAWKLFLKLWLKPLRLTPGREQPAFQHLAEKPSSAAQLGFALLTLLLTPIYVPVGTIGVALRAMKTAPEHERGTGETESTHQHVPDGSCCKKN
jgi:hypothetical protein